MFKFEIWFVCQLSASSRISFKQWKMYSLIVRQEIRNHCCIHRFPVRSCLKKFLTTETRPCGKNVSSKQQRNFSWSRVKNSREGKLEISNSEAKPQVKQVPKLSELRKLMQVAKPEKWKITGTENSLLSYQICRCL